MKKTLTLSHSLTKALLGIVLLHTAGSTIAMAGNQTDAKAPRPSVQRLQKHLQTLKDDWKCLFKRGPRKCTWKQKARIAGELVLLAVLIEELTLGIGRGIGTELLYRKRVINKLRKFQASRLGAKTSVLKGWPREWPLRNIESFIDTVETFPEESRVTLDGNAAKLLTKDPPFADLNFESIKEVQGTVVGQTVDPITKTIWLKVKDAEGNVWHASPFIATRISK